MGKRRANGEGTLRQRKDGRWESVFMIGWKDNGRPLCKCFYGKTQAEVKQKVQAWKKTLPNNSIHAYKDYQFSEWADMWFEIHKNNISATTQEGYRYTLRALKEHFGHKKLAEIKAYDIEVFLRKLREKGRADSTLAQYKGMLYQIMHKAEANDLIHKNPARFVEKIRSTKPKQRKEVFTAEEVQTLMRELPYDRTGLSIRLLLGTGMRSQELYILYDLGLFQGAGYHLDGTPNFDLDRIPTRYEAVTMLVRLLGKESEAKEGTWDTPFTDVVAWAEPYVGYAYANGLTGGTGPKTFGGNAPVSATQYITFILRALGYSSETDFEWDKAWTLSDKLGLTHGEFGLNQSNISRGGVAALSADALQIEYKDGNGKLFEKLIDEGVFTAEQYAQAISGDSTNNIVIDLSTYIENNNAAHRAVLDTKFTDEFIQTNGPDFYDTLDIVSEAEAKSLLTSEQRETNEFCTKEDALRDIDLLFRVYKSFYGPYYFFGDDETFGAAEARIIEEVNSYPNEFTLETLASVIAKNLYFIKDRHMNIGPELLGETNKIAVHDYYVKNLWFYEDDVGYYTKKQNHKWYLSSVGNDKSIGDYFKITVDEKGQLCYMLGLTVTVDDPRLTTAEITLARGNREVHTPIVWSKFETRSNYSVSETVIVQDGIPLLESDTVSGWNFPDEEYDIQQERLRQMGPDILSQDVVILNMNSGCGWQSLFDSVDHQVLSLRLYKLSKTAEHLGRWNMPWGQGDFGEYAMQYFSGKWGNNNTLVFAVQDQSNFSAAEDTIADIRTIENVILVGGSTGGTAGPNAGTNQGMVLPNTGLYVHFGASLMISPGYTEEGYCFEPDIWVNPTDAVDAVYRLCMFYGVNNTADTSILDQYQ